VAFYKIHRWGFVFWIIYSGQLLDHQKKISLIRKPPTGGFFFYIIAGF